MKRFNGFCMDILVDSCWLMVVGYWLFVGRFGRVPSCLGVRLSRLATHRTGHFGLRQARSILHASPNDKELFLF